MNGLKTDTIINRDALYALRELPEESVHCCVTSPPYYALRDYGLDMQIGREDTPEQYIDRLTEVFRELRRVLRSDGTLWLNIADTYCGTGNKGYHADPKNPKGRNGQQIAKNNRVSGCKQKDLIGIPWLLAFALRADGWYLRSDIIWQKENPMPESVKDRPTRCYEHIFLLTKSKKYFYDAAAIAEPLAPTTAARYRTGRSAGQKYADEVPGQGKVQGLNRARSGSYYDEALMPTIIPHMHMYAIEDVVKQALSYSQRHNRKVVFAYLLLPGINDRSSDIRQLAKWFKGKNVMINVLQYNPTSNSKIRAPQKQEMVAFKHQLEQTGLEVTMRVSHGREIKAACGQLANTYNKAKKQQK